MKKGLCRETREIVSNIDWDCEVKTLFRDENLGCKDAVSSAITWFFENVEDGIILEDDCLPCKSFFSFCDELLEKYRGTKEIMHIGGNNFQFNKTENDSDYYFSRVSHIWGWATWKDRWQLFDIEMKELDNFIKSKKIESLFNTEKFQEYWINIFLKVKNNQLNSWAYIWSFTVLKNKGLTIIPSTNLVQNIGFDRRATHTRNKPGYISKFNTEAEKNKIANKIKHPEKISARNDLDLLYFNKTLNNKLVNIIINILKKIKLYSIARRLYNEVLN